MGGIPNILQGSHGLSGHGDALLNVLVVLEAKGDEGAKICEVRAESYITIFDMYGFGLVLVVIEIFFVSACVYSHCSVRRLLLVSASSQWSITLCISSLFGAGKESMWESKKPGGGEEDTFCL